MRGNSAEVETGNDQYAPNAARLTRLDLGILNVRTMSFGDRPNFTRDTVSQSSWPLDPDANFLTRTSSFYGDTFVFNTLGSSKNTMRPDRLAPAGELQSHVFRYGLGANKATRGYNTKAPIYPRISALYSRCHTLGS